MTVVVGVHPDRDAADALALAAAIAGHRPQRLVVATVIPMPWTTPSMARVDAEFDQWAADLAARAAHESRAALAGLPASADVEYRAVRHTSVSGGLLQAVADSGAHTLVLGSADGPDGQVSLGSTGDRLLHSSSVTTAISPRGYAACTPRFTSLCCAYAGTPDSVGAVRSAVRLASTLDVPLRVVTLAVRGRTMYPPEVGLDAEDAVLAALADQSRAALAALRADGVIGPDVATCVATGDSWRTAMSAAGVEPDEPLVVGTSPRGPIRRVFLGSRAAKIVRSSPAPVIVLPG